MPVAGLRSRLSLSRKEEHFPLTTCRRWERASYHGAAAEVRPQTAQPGHLSPSWTPEEVVVPAELRAERDVPAEPAARRTALSSPCPFSTRKTGREQGAAYCHSAGKEARRTTPSSRLFLGCSRLSRPKRNSKPSVKGHPSASSRTRHRGKPRLSPLRLAALSRPPLPVRQAA